MKNWILVALVLLLIPMKVFAADTKLISTKAISSKNKYPHGHYINKEGIYIEDKQNPQGVPPGGTVIKVVEGSSADLSGLKTGDVIYAVDHVRIQTVKDIHDHLDPYLSPSLAGAILPLRIWRDGQQLEINLNPVK